MAITSEPPPAVAGVLRSGMANNPPSNISSLSTSSRWHLSTITAPRRGTTQPPQASSLASRSKWRPFWKRGQVLITYKGGAECSYLFQMNGRTWRFCGHDCLHDVMNTAAQRLL